MKIQLKKLVVVIMPFYVGPMPICSGTSAWASEAPEPSGVAIFPPPPKGFDPGRADEKALQAYGFPPAPDRSQGSYPHNVWIHAVLSDRRRVVPRFELSHVYHTVPLLRQQAAGTNASYSFNWSGFSISNQVKLLSSNSYYASLFEYEVPIAQQAFGTCFGTDYSSQWAGLDGVQTSDIVQAGTEADAACSGGRTTPSYYAWYEWYPNPAYRISNFAIYPGNVIYTEVYAVSTLVSALYIVNETTHSSTAFQFPAPSGVKFSGSSSEWVVERPYSGNNITTLANYVKLFSDYGVALLANGQNTAVYPGGTLPNGSWMTDYIMVDNSGRVISVPTLLGVSAVSFADQGSAY